MQDPSNLQYINEAVDAMSEQPELAFSTTVETTSTHEHSSGPNVAARLPRQRMFRAGRGHWLSTSFKPSYKQALDGRCSASCRCKCHSTTPKHLPKSLQRLSRQLFPAVEGETILACKCNRLDCRMRNVGRTRIIILHSHLLKRAIEASFLMNGFRLRVRLQSHPVVSESSDIVRFARMGDFESLARMIRTGQASIFDATEDGWTILHVCSCRPLDTIMRLKNLECSISGPFRDR
jgi:hypothetical protein